MIDPVVLALNAKGKPATLYPANSQRCAACGEALPRVMVTEYRPSLGRNASWSVLDFSQVEFWRGNDYHNDCAAIVKAGA